VTAEILGLTAPSVANDPEFRDWYTRYQRLAVPRGASAATYTWITEVDVRAVLPSIRVPTLVITRSGARHHRAVFGRYLAEHIPGATSVELPGADTFPMQAGDFETLLDHVEQFLTGARGGHVTDRMLATILFTDIVGSTALAARKGDAAWLSVIRRHDGIVRGLLGKYRGREMRQTGDGSLAIFDGPARAVACAARIREALARSGIEVRAASTPGRSSSPATRSPGSPCTSRPASWRRPAPAGSSSRRP
jgi:hypothetical protein